MKILVIDDKEKNLEKAVELLKDHEVTTASSYDEAEKYLCGNLPHIQANGRWENIGWNEEYVLNKYEFDAVLTDLLMPASERGVPEKYQSKEEVPYGLVIAMTAMRLGIPVAIVTSANHHSHPILWAMDTLQTTKEDPMFGGLFEFREDFDNSFSKNWLTALEALIENKN